MQVQYEHQELTPDTLLAHCMLSNPPPPSQPLRAGSHFSIYLLHQPKKIPGTIVIPN